MFMLLIYSVLINLGSVLNEILISGVACDPPPTCPTLVVIPEADTSIPATSQKQLAIYLKADSLCYPRMSHVGPLLSNKAKIVASEVANWIISKL